MLNCENLVKVRLKTLMTILPSLKLSCLNTYCVTASSVVGERRVENATTPRIFWSGCAARTCNFLVPFFRKRKLLKTVLFCTAHLYGLHGCAPLLPPTHTHTRLSVHQEKLARSGRSIREWRRENEGEGHNLLSFPFAFPTVYQAPEGGYHFVKQII